MMSGNNREEMRKRVQNAAEYQKKAILALLPERMAAHIQVIGKELEMMAAETAADLVAACGRELFKGAAAEGTDQARKSKKVDIL